jgi:hypothetical protein
MFATVLYRMAGNPKVEFGNQFEDVKAGPIIWSPGERPPVRNVLPC